MTDDLAALEQRVAALEAAVEPLTRTTRGFLRDCRIDTFRAGLSPSMVRITHLPTGVTAEGEWAGAVAELGAKLIGRGDISINDARAAIGLPEFDGEWADTAQPLPAP